jgi:hypothetical protein
MNKLKFSIIVLLNFFLINNSYSQNESYYKEIFNFIENSNEVKEYFDINNDFDSPCFCASNDVVFISNTFFIDEIIDYEFNVDSSTKKILREILLKNETEKYNLLKDNYVLYNINELTNISKDKCKVMIFFSHVSGNRVRADVYLTNKFVQDRMEAGWMSQFLILFLFYFEDGKISKVFFKKYT